MHGFNRVVRGTVFSARHVSLQFGARLNGPASFRGMGTVTIGRYAAIGRNLTVLTSNHVMNMLNLNVALQAGIGARSNREEGTDVAIGAGCWIGDNVTVVASSIGIGAVVGAGSIVTKDIAPFSVMAGNPAKLIKMRFSDHVIDAILTSRWWEMNKQELRAVVATLSSDIGSMSEEDAIALLEKIR